MSRHSLLTFHSQKLPNTNLTQQGTVFLVHRTYHALACESLAAKNTLLSMHGRYCDQIDGVAMPGLTIGSSPSNHFCVILKRSGSCLARIIRQCNVDTVRRRQHVLFENSLNFYNNISQQSPQQHQIYH